MPMSPGSMPVDERKHQRHIIGLTRLCFKLSEQNHFVNDNNLILTVYR